MKAVIIGLEALISLSLVSTGFTLLMVKMFFAQQTALRSYTSDSSLFSQEEKVQQAIYTIRNSNLSLYQTDGVLNATFGNGYSLEEINSAQHNQSSCECTERLLAIDGNIYLLKVWGNEKTAN